MLQCIHFTIIINKLNNAKVENAYSFQKPMEHVQNDLLGNTYIYTKIEKSPQSSPKVELHGPPKI